MSAPRLRVGQGFDVHPLVEGRPLVLAGVRVPFELGLDGHSDADVVAHAACEALLSAAGQGDLGQHFPPGDPRFAGASSLELCRVVAKLLVEAGWSVVNLSVTVVCDQPRLGPLLPVMRESLAGALEVDTGQLQLTPKSSEGLGFTGRGEGIAAIAVCLLSGA
ncbi:MAG TPA: 2-C-methyl-D-erythritol 2,4-cyclodiphosphate synthase [Actinomycetota bacterium]